MYDIIRGPVITEKATTLSETGQMVFRVAIDATKPEIKAAVEGLFNVKVLAVNTLVAKGKTKRFRGRPGRRSDVKKAYVRLAAGQSIDLSSRTGLTRMQRGTEDFQPRHAEPARHGPDRPQRAVERQAGQGADRRQVTRPAGATSTATSPAASVAAGTSARYRIVDFRRRKFDVPATVERLEYDPNRTAFIALIKYQDGELSYILAPQRLRAGDQVVSAQRADIKPGNAMPLAAIPVGTIVHNVEMKPGAGGKIARAAGQYVQLVGKDAGYAQIKLMSRRAAHRARRVHGHDRRRLQPGQRQPCRSARPGARAGWAASRTTAAW